MTRQMRSAAAVRRARERAREWRAIQQEEAAKTRQAETLRDVCPKPMGVVAAGHSVADVLDAVRDYLTDDDRASADAVLGAWRSAVGGQRDGESVQRAQWQRPPRNESEDRDGS